MNRPTTLPARILQSFLLLSVLLCGPLASLRAQDTLVSPDFPSASLPEGPRLPKEPVPPAPAGMILDQASVLQPEAMARLSARLVAAHAQGVSVYVVTVPSLNVPPSKRSERLDAAVRNFAESWTPNSVGAVILFDDESGLMSMLLSPETDRRFAAFAVELELKAPLTKAQESGLAREKLERSADIVVEILSRHNADAKKKARRDLIGNLTMAAIALVGVALAIWSAVGGKKVAEPVVGKAADEDQAKS